MAADSLKGRGHTDRICLADRVHLYTLLTFMFAGHETSSLALTCTCLELATRDDVLERVQHEVDDVVGGGRPGFEHVSDLQYVDRLIRETLRLYPPAFILFRRVTADTVIGGYHIPADTIVILPQFRLHLDERYWGDPDTFDPDRWLVDGCEDRPESDQPTSERPEYAYFSFGGGPRHCIGMRFAMLELKLAIAALAQRFDLTLLSDPDPDFEAQVTLHPAESVRVRLHDR